MDKSVAVAMDCVDAIVELMFKELHKGSEGTFTIIDEVIALDGTLIDFLPVYG